VLASRSFKVTVRSVSVSTSVQEIPTQYSVVVPVFNEEGNVEALALRVVAAMERIGEPFE
jgi:hypothetical protein